LHRIERKHEPKGGANAETTVALDTASNATASVAYRSQTHPATGQLCRFVTRRHAIVEHRSNQVSVGSDGQPLICSNTCYALKVYAAPVILHFDDEMCAAQLTAEFDASTFRLPGSNTLLG
jgi:hypothetical protein